MYNIVIHYYGQACNTAIIIINTGAYRL